MYALRERRVHVTQEDFEMAVTKVGFSLNRIFLLIFNTCLVAIHDEVCSR